MERTRLRLAMIRHHATDIGLRLDDTIPDESVIKRWFKTYPDAEETTISRTKNQSPVNFQPLHSVGLSGSDLKRGLELQAKNSSSPLSKFFANRNRIAEDVKSNAPTETDPVFTHSFSELWPAPDAVDPELESAPSSSISANATPPRDRAGTQVLVTDTSLPFNRSSSVNGPAPYNLGTGASCGSAVAHIFADPNWSTKTARAEVPVSSAGIPFYQSFSENWPAPYNLGTQPELPLGAASIFAKPNSPTRSTEPESDTFLNQSSSEDWPAPGADGSEADSSFFSDGSADTDIAAQWDAAARRGILLTRSFSENWPTSSYVDTQPESETLVVPSDDSDEPARIFREVSPPGSSSEASSGAVMNFPSAFELPLPNEQKNPYGGHLHGWLPHGKRNLGFVTRPFRNEALLSEPIRSAFVESWKAMIRDRLSNNPNWLKEWLNAYGPQVLEILTDTQAEALLGVTITHLRREAVGGRQQTKPHRKFKRLLWHLMRAQTFPADVFRRRLDAVTTRPVDKKQRREQIDNGWVRTFEKSPLSSVWVHETSETVAARDSSRDAEPSERARPSFALVGKLRSFFDEAYDLLNTEWEVKAAVKAAAIEGTVQQAINAAKDEENDGSGTPSQPAGSAPRFRIGRVNLFSALAFVTSRERAARQNSDAIEGD
ncbi:hypothetical protein VTK26DRAFT_4895 [Humicola hyalothermophila]